MIWYFDSGASRHITSRKDLFSSLDAAPAGKKVTCANNASYPIKGVGKILITISDGSDLCLPDVLYVPGIKKNLLSVSSLAKNGLRVIFEDDRCIVRDRENGYSLITTGTLENGLFVLDRYEKQIQACIAETKTQAMQDAELWHARFGHVGYGSLMTLQRHNMVHDLSLLEMPPRHVCEGCVLGKMHRFAFSQDGSVRATRKLQLVHSDVCGPMRTPSVGNSLYFVTFIDDFSRFCWVYPLKAKSDVFAVFQHYVSMVENETGCKVQTLRTDRGGEYMSGAFKDFLGNACISWLSKKQPTVATSTCEAEYRAAFTATVDCVWIRRLLADLCECQQASTTIFTDSQSAMAVARNPVFHARTKHIEVHYHYVRERLHAGEITLTYCPTQDNIADLFTKALSREKFEAFRKALGLLSYTG
ncbi:hypothetical protein L7F22_011796 [Adiantum nelumboides]|nr:hypothetical protein [Adiantum nelumboides]